MEKAGWRTRAGFALAILGAALLAHQLLFPSGPASNALPGEPIQFFDLHFMGKSILKIPASAGALAAVLRAKRFFIALLTLAGGVFLFFLDTAAGRRFSELVRKNFDEK
ncbi:MAG: hypothetical protein HOC91_05440 [Nitrospinaceae bacterium]|nr:hypothetical protein [Nitrospinaceae bacterium]MBT4429940.1 hypothetical protein [Nitrospinaceae bacterium]MBT5368369.1 hypothetical protein [Nitrospinaceae bacterium]MBT5947911.1 hypothetical protein [Nitrospinaceae bacterium]MBT6395329.1 hypothetical protein [Nitrospinaceae bacterium]